MNDAKKTKAQLLEELASMKWSCTLRKPFPISELIARVRECEEDTEENAL